MPRKARGVAPGVPHHVTQRGVGRQTVFFTKRDRQVYLGLLADQSRLAHLRVLAYCLMSNHIHLVVVPAEVDSLALCLQRVHGRYAQYLNARRRRSGHLWQNRFFSCPLDSQHLWTALRYVEQNPVRAGLVIEPEDWRWSSATAHLGGRDESRALDLAFWRETGGADAWRQLIEQTTDSEELHRLRRATYACRPCGDKAFTAALLGPIPVGA